MDSLTQATLGAAVGHASWGKQLGRPALFWGAALGTLPDLDILLYPVLDDIQRLYWHRGSSHSIWFTVLGGMVIGWLLWKGRWKERQTLARAMTGVFLIFATHITIDYFTIYGTQLLAPFSRYGFGRGNMFIIDPLYTVPLLFGTLIAGITKKSIGWKANWAGILISSLYAVFSLASHGYADATFKRHLEAQNIEVLQSITGATPMNTLLWRHVARTPEGLLIGYFSILGDRAEEEIHFDLVPRNEDLIAPFQEQRNVKTVKWFSQGFWVAEQNNDVLTLSDLRFGEFRFSEGDPPEKWQYIFSWEITDDPNSLSQQSPGIRDGRAAFAVLWKRLTGSVS